jgi:hypothetical protein
LRGYEAYFSIQANKEYKLKRQMVWKAVLHEQARQRHQGRTDSMMMQLVSSHATQWARDTATELGMQDAQVALSIFLDYMREQAEDDDDDDLEEYDECNEEDDFDDAPIAVNWNEPVQEEDFSACLDFSSMMLPPNSLELSLSGTTTTTTTSTMAEPHNVSFSSHQSSQEEEPYYCSDNNHNSSGWNVPEPQQQQLTLDNAGYNHHYNHYNTTTERRVS